MLLNFRGGRVALKWYPDVSFVYFDVSSWFDNERYLGTAYQEPEWYLGTQSLSQGRTRCLLARYQILYSRATTLGLYCIRYNYTV